MNSEQNPQESPAVNESSSSQGTQKRTEVPASALAHMMGVATSTEIKLMESRLDLLTSKVSTLTARLEQLFGLLNKAPTGADLERIDVQIGSLKTLIKETLSKALGAAPLEDKPEEESSIVKPPPDLSHSKRKSKILSNTEEHSS